MLGCFGWLIKLNYVRALQFHQNLDFPPHYFFIFYCLERNGFYGQQLIFVFFDVASIDCPKAPLTELYGCDYIPLYDFASHDYLL